MGYFGKLNSGKGIPFMDGREKGDIENMLDTDLHIRDFGFIDGEEGRFSVIDFAENDREFYFGNSVLTDMLEQVERDGMRDELPKQVIRLFKRTSKKGREYTAFEFIEDDVEKIPF